MENDGVSFRRKVLIVFVVVAAALSLVAVAIWLNAGKSSRSAGLTSSGTGPKVTFASGARTGNGELDTFVRDFVELCLKGDYDGFRLCWTAYSQPISSSRFRAMWGMAEEIVITQITAVPGKKGKAYLVKVSATLSPKAKSQHRDVEVLVISEDGKWVIAPAPRAEPDEKNLPSIPVTDTIPSSQPVGHG